MRQIKFKGGTLQVPEDWIDLGDVLEKPSEAQNAYVVECHHWNRFGIPHFFGFTSREKACDFSEEETERIKAACATAWPDFEQVMLAQPSTAIPERLKGKYRELIVGQTWDRPTIGIFMIDADDDIFFTPEKEPPFGAIINR